MMEGGITLLVQTNWWCFGFFWWVLGYACCVYDWTDSLPFCRSDVMPFCFFAMLGPVVPIFKFLFKCRGNDFVIVNKRRGFS